MLLAARSPRRRRTRIRCRDRQERGADGIPVALPRRRHQSAGSIPTRDAAVRAKATISTVATCLCGSTTATATMLIAAGSTVICVCPGIRIAVSLQPVIGSWIRTAQCSTFCVPSFGTGSQVTLPSAAIGETVGAFRPQRRCLPQDGDQCRLTVILPFACSVSELLTQVPVLWWPTLRRGRKAEAEKCACPLAGLAP